MTRARPFRGAPARPPVAEFGPIRAADLPVPLSGFAVGGRALARILDRLESAR